METILNALEGTPWYVYFIFFYVVYIGLVSLKPRTVKFRVIFILPAILTLWSFSMFFARLDKTGFNILSWITGLLIGMGIGWWILSFYKFQIDRGRGTITLPGNRWTLVLVLAIFAVRYSFGYLYATMDFIPKHFIISDFAISGFLVGIFIGRAFHYCRIYYRK